MELELLLKQKIVKALETLDVNLTENDIVIEHSKDKAHGDFATNVALKYSRLVSKRPNLFAEDIVNAIDREGIEKIEIAGPGFINFFMKNDSLQSIVKKILSEGEDFGRGEKKNFKINVEFVSANPTGDLHVGHARGAAIGDSICRILDFAGYDVTREYYINDAGSQITHLAESLLARYREAQGLDFTLPEDGYHGEDVKIIAQKIYEEIGDAALKMDDPIPYFKEKGIEYELKKIVEDLNKFGVHFDVFTSERKIRFDGAIEKEIEYLKDYVYKDNGALLLRTSDFLDDKDRVIRKSNGEYTYYMPDIVYHVDKMNRGFDQLVVVLGADHHGYINRMKSALMMHGYKPEVYEVELIQMVRFIKDGKEYKASKRTGDAITLRDLCEEVGVDATRYFFVMRSASGHLDFDMTLAVEQSSNNPVYYAQYAHARICSILEQGKNIEIDESGSKLEKESEKNLLKHLSSFPGVVLDAAEERAPYKITNYIHQLAELIHSFYTECRVIDAGNLETSSSRLALCKASQIILKKALNLIGVSAPEKM